MTSDRPARVLIVEDEDLVREYTAMLVSALGHEVVAAVPRARDALDLLAAGEKVDLLMTDLVMPGGIDGRQLAEAVLRDHPDIGVLLISGHEDDAGLGPGPGGVTRTAFLHKPFRKSQLAECLSALLGP